jgi:hypothetical protein
LAKIDLTALHQKPSRNVRYESIASARASALNVRYCSTSVASRRNEQRALSAVSRRRLTSKTCAVGGKKFSATSPEILALLKKIEKRGRPLLVAALDSPGYQQGRHQQRP